MIEEVWDGLSESGLEPELDSELKKLLDQSLAALDPDPENVVSQDEVKAYVRRSR